MRRTLVLLTLLIGLGLMAVPAFGQVDPQFAIGDGLGGTCPTGQCGFGTGTVSGEVNAVSANKIDIFNTNAAQAYTGTTTGPLLLIVGLPGTAGNPAPPSISLFSNAADTTSDGTGQLGPAAPVWLGGAGTGFGGGNGWGNWNASGAGNGGSNDWTGPAGKPTSAGPFLALPDESSQDYGNWTTIDSQIGVTIGSTQGFDLWVYELNLSSDIAGKTGVDVVFSGSGLPVGTLIFATGCLKFTDCSGTNNLFFTPFTTSGDVVPEPASMALMGTFLLGAYSVLRRKLRSA